MSSPSSAPAKKKASLKEFAVHLDSAVSVDGGCAVSVDDHDDNSFTLTLTHAASGAAHRVHIRASVHPPRKPTTSTDEAEPLLPRTPVAVPDKKPPPVPTLLAAPAAGSSAALSHNKSPRGAGGAESRESFGAPITERPTLPMQRYVSTPHAVSAIATLRAPSSPRAPPSPRAPGDVPALPPRRPMRGRAAAVTGGGAATLGPSPTGAGGPGRSAGSFRSAPTRPPPSLNKPLPSTPSPVAPAAAAAASTALAELDDVFAGAALPSLPATPDATAAATAAAPVSASEKRRARVADSRKSQRMVAEKLDAANDDVSDLLQATKDAPDDPTKHHALGFAYANLQHNHEAAVKAYDRAIALDADVDEYHNDRGVSLYELARFDDAVAAYERALALTPEHAMALINCGNAFRQLGRLDDALPLYDRACLAEPTLALAWTNRGNARRAARRWRDAADDYRRALEICGGDDVAVVAKLGHVLRELGDAAEAKRLLRRCVDAEPAEAAPYLALCSVLEHGGELDEATRVARTAAQRFAADPLCLLQLGALLYQTGDAAQSASVCEKATALNGELSDAWNQLGVSRLACGRTADAEAAFKRAVATAGADKTALASSCCNLAQLYDQEGRYDDATEFFRRSLDAEPNNAATLNKLGACLVNANRVDEAIKRFEQALAIDARNIQAHYNVAAAHANSGRLAVALKHCEQALGVDPAFAPALGMLKQLRAALAKQKK